MMRLRLACFVCPALALAVGCPPGTANAQAQAPAGNPFQLKPVEQSYLDQVLSQWEDASAKIQNFSCPFTRFTYNAWSPAPTVAFRIEDGKVSYDKPDKGSFKIEVIKQWTAAPVAPGQSPAANQAPRGAHKQVFPETGDEKTGVVGDHWVSDGKHIYEYRPNAKELAVTPIPPDMQGEKIVNGPFPFLFGAKADDLKRRFWMRIHPNPDQNVIHLVALPKTRQDAASYRAVELQLDRRTLLPRGMQVHAPDKGREVFSFHLSKVSINARRGLVWQALFQSPRTPWGWRRVVNGPQPGLSQTRQATAGGAPATR